MNFRRHRQDEPEINLIPFIDVLLVVLIFLMLSTTYSKFTELQLKLPVADTDAQRDYPKELIVAVSADGSYSINRNAIAGRKNRLGEGRWGRRGRGRDELADPELGVGAGVLGEQVGLHECAPPDEIGRAHV